MAETGIEEPRAGTGNEVQVMELEKRLKKIIHEQMCIEEKLIIPDALFIEDFSVDSIDAIELASAIENEFGIEIPDEEIEGIRTVADAMAYVKARADLAATDG